jgi:hypothetical protein
MDKVQKPIDSESYTPSSNPLEYTVFRYLEVSAEYGTMGSYQTLVQFK